MACTFREAQGIAIIEITEGFEARHGATLEQLLDRLLSEGRRHFVVDLKRVEGLDCPGLSALVRGFTYVRRRAGTLCLVNLQPPVQSILTLMRLDHVFESYTDVAEAVQCCASGLEERQQQRPSLSRRGTPSRWDLCHLAATSRTHSSSRDGSASCSG